MPVVSFSLSESLRKAIKKLVQGKYYKNSSNVMRDALTRLMNSYSDIDLIAVDGTDTEYGIKPIVGNVIIVIDKYNEHVERKIAKLELAYKDAIKSKYCYYHDEDKSITYVVEDDFNNFHKFVTELNQIEELKNIRYIIL